MMTHSAMISDKNYLTCNVFAIEMYEIFVRIYRRMKKKLNCCFLLFTDCFDTFFTDFFCMNV